MRGGTSKGVFFLREALPDDPQARDWVLLRALGSPDPFLRQIDGLGSGTSSTSKAVIISPSSRPDSDVDFLFAQVSVDRPLVDYSGTCGDLSAAVGPFAIQEGLIAAAGEPTIVRVWQVNTGRRIIAHVPTRGGSPSVQGDFAVHGVPNPGAEIRLEFLDPGGSVSGTLLPTGHVIDDLRIPGHGLVAVTLIDAATPVVFVRAIDVGLSGTELPDDLDHRPELLALLEAIRAHGAVAMGLAASPEEATAQRSATPKLALVAAPAAYRTTAGEVLQPECLDLVVRMLSMGKVHHVVPATGAVAAAVAAMIPGTLAHQAADLAAGEGEVRIGHPAGVLRLGAVVRRDGGNWTVERAIMSRTARLLMKGAIRLPEPFPPTPIAVRESQAGAGRTATVAASSSQAAIPAVLMRGGTSRGVFFRWLDLPSAGELRDRIILSAFGSPDPYGKQIDGLGGATSVTSKVVIVGPSAEPNCDVDYFFGQVDIRRPLIDYTGSCGNLSAAVGPFAVEEGLVAATGPITQVRIWQVNTKKRIVAHIPTAAGVPDVDGDFMIDGVPFPGARIRLDYLDPGGSLARDFLPTGHAADVLDIPGLGCIDVTLVDATNPVVCFRAADLGLRGDELADEIDTRPDLLRTIEAIRGHGAVAMGLASSPEEATRRQPGTPKVAFVSPPARYRTQKGTHVDAGEVTLVSRIMSMGTLHRTHAVTGAIAVAAAALVRGSVVHAVARLTSRDPEQEIRIGHPSGILPVGARVAQEGGRWVCEKGSTFRTARRLMEGYAYVPSWAVAGLTPLAL